MSAFETAPPSLSTDMISGLAASLYSLSGSWKSLVSERDQNLRLDAQGSNDRYVLKISNADEDRALVDLQCACLSHMALCAPELALPRLIKTKDGKEIGQTGLANGEADHMLRLVSYLDGTTYADMPKSTSLRRALGSFMGYFSRAMSAFGHPAAHQPDFLWNLDNVDGCRAFVADIADAENRAMVERFFDRYDKIVRPIFPKLRGAVIHHDANDYNLIVNQDESCEHGYAIGLIDFGDMAYSRQVNELAVTLAYALMDGKDLISEGSEIVASYCEQFDLTDEEFTALPIQLAMRLVMSVCISSNRAKDFQDNDYLTISQKPAFDLLARLDKLNPHFLTAAWRKATGKPATPNAAKVIDWLQSQQGSFANIFEEDLNRLPRMILSMADGAKGNELLADGNKHWDFIKDEMKEQGAEFAIGLYAEDRVCYRTPAFKASEGDAYRSIHLGFDIFLEAGTPIHAPLDGEVVSIVNNEIYLDYGPTLILKHEAGETGEIFYTLYGHLALETMDLVKAGDKVNAGQKIGYLGAAEVNVGWAPHLHLQIMTDLLGEHGNFYGAGEPHLMHVWGDISPDPNLLFGFHETSFDMEQSQPKDLLLRRRDTIGPSLSLSYKNPVKMVGGKGPYLIDHTGRHYLDLVNNICHVGHCHPQVVKAISEQAARLNTNTRYLHDNILNYAERLTATLPDPLSVCYFTCSGSEANELAMRIARTVTGNSDMICLDWAYHGNSAANIAISPYKFNRAGGAGCPQSTQIAQMPDPYRGEFKGYGIDASKAYTKSVAEKISIIRAKGHEGPAAFIAESMLGCGGQIVLPNGYLAEAYKHVRATGGLCIADEVQVGFGRDGEHMWAFEHQNVVPDIVVLGKPIGNGHPMAAVVTTPEIAAAFANGMEYFNSFGGNPVSCAVGMAVLDVIESEGLQQNAYEIGQFLRDGFKDMATRYPLIGDVRGRGLFIGVELVKDHETLDPATKQAAQITNILRDNSILMSTDGPLDNVLKIKPPIIHSKDHAQEVLIKTEAAFKAIQ
ncbi:MAG: aminotransferase class III-fold pyridoxal phosphate-dependent enzyme [Cohaesibacter sp.]|nr:aminotransferase class III-fold pyridoxal phosphate-dependent enzyme [Cohaesibacter sp.]